MLCVFSANFIITKYHNTWYIMNTSSIMLFLANILYLFIFSLSQKHPGGTQIARSNIYISLLLWKYFPGVMIWYLCHIAHPQNIAWSVFVIHVCHWLGLCDIDFFPACHLPLNNYVKLFYSSRTDKRQETEAFHRIRLDDSMGGCNNNTSSAVGNCLPVATTIAKTQLWIKRWFCSNVQ